MHQKYKCAGVVFFLHVSKWAVWFKETSSLTILFSSILFPSLIFLFSFVFSLNWSKQGCKGGGEEETSFAFRIKDVFVHDCGARCGRSSIEFARRMT